MAGGGETMIDKKLSKYAWRIAYNRLQNRHDADEAMQEALMNLHRHVERSPGQYDSGHVKALVVQHVHWACGSLLRKRMATKAASLDATSKNGDGEESRTIPEPESSFRRPDEEAEVNDDKRKLREAMRYLTVRERRFVQAVDLKEQTLQHVADAEGLSAQRVRHIVESGLDKLKQRMNSLLPSPGVATVRRQDSRQTAAVACGFSATA